MNKRIIRVEKIAEIKEKIHSIEEEQRQLKEVKKLLILSGIKNKNKQMFTL